MKKRVFAALLSAALLLTVCTGCGGTKSSKTRSRVEGVLDETLAAASAAVEGAAVSVPEETPADKTAELQAAFDAITVDSRYAACKRYVLVNDYDGDGRQEAFGYFGEAKMNGEYPQWERLHIYYISADGAVTSVYNADDEFSEDDMLCGGPVNQKTLEPTDFSASYISSGKQTFALFDVGYPYSDYFTMALTIYNGEPTVSYPDSGLSAGADGYFVAYGYDDQTIYTVKDGKFVQVGTAASSELANSAVEKTTPEKAWAKYKSGILSDWADLYGCDTTNALEYLITADYDGDGRQEAYAVLAEAKDDWELSNWAGVYYITPDGYIFCVQKNASDGSWLYGGLADDENYASDPQSCLMTAGSQKFLRWEISAGGSSSVTAVYGVKDGIPYQPEISEDYQWFHEENGKYYGTTSDFSKDYHDYIDHEFTFDAASGEFNLK